MVNLHDGNVSYEYYIRQTSLIIFLLVTLSSTFLYHGIFTIIIPIVSILSLFVAMFLHGKARYGLKNIVLFFIITWLVSHFFEALSIQTGFPFGHYFYDKLAGPRLFNVPLIIMPAYFGTGYASWIIATILLGQYYQLQRGNLIFFVPLIASFIMVMWDICLDPIASTALSLWVWQDGGPYFGVPIQNYLGWFFVVYIIFQLFALYLAKYEVINRNKTSMFMGRLFWFEAIIAYTGQAISQLMNPLNSVVHLQIIYSMALVTVFTMIYIVITACIKLYNEPPRLIKEK